MAVSDDDDASAAESIAAVIPFEISTYFISSLIFISPKDLTIFSLWAL
jgi:hypothetical protein